MMLDELELKERREKAELDGIKPKSLELTKDELNLSETQAILSYLDEEGD